MSESRTSYYNGKIIFLLILFALIYVVVVGVQAPSGSFLKALLSNPACVTLYLVAGVAYFLFPREVELLLGKFLKAKIDEYLGDDVGKSCKQDEEGWKKIREVTTNDKKDVTRRGEVIVDRAPKKKDMTNDDMDARIASGQGLVLISELFEEIKQMESDEEKFKIRLQIEAVYCRLDETVGGRFGQDRVNNLKALIDSNLGKARKGVFWIKIMFCYVMQNTDANTILGIIPDVLNACKRFPAEILAMIWEIRAMSYINIKEPGYAISSYKEVLRYTTEQGRIYRKMASISFRILEDAPRAYDYACLAFSSLGDGECDLKTDKLYRELVFIQYRSAAFKKDYNSAYEIINSYVSISKSDEFVSDQAYIALRLKKVNEAMVLAQKSIDADCEDITAKNVLGQIACYRGEFKSSLKYFNAIEKQFRKDARKNRFSKYYWAEILYFRAWAYAELKCFSNARKDFVQAIKSGYSEFDLKVYDLIEIGVRKAS